MSAPARAVLSGLGVSPGAAAGPVVRLQPGAAPATAPVAAPGTPAEAAALVAAAVGAVAADLAQRAQSAVLPEARGVLEAQSMMAADPEIASAVRARLDVGDPPVAAVTAAFDSYAQLLAGLGGYLAERAQDLADVARRVVALLEGRDLGRIPDPGHPFVLVADDLAPSDTATLDPERVIALVVAGGGPTSHTAILARALGIPAVVGCTGSDALTDGDVVLVDGEAGTVVLRPTDEEVGAAARAAAERARRAASVSGPGRTSDGVAVCLLVNVGKVDDALRAAEADSEGVGLFRTEFLFLDRHDEPTVDEQAEAYAAVLRAFEGRKVVVRTLDAGSDKPLPFLSRGGEPNPALGIRGLRTSRLRPDVTDRQLLALALAASRTGTVPHVMAPMVTTAAEARDFAAVVRRHGLPSAGVMVEVPAAALRAEQLLRHADFASIGTNDLTQYAVAADREVSALADLLDPWQPAVLELVALTCRGAAVHGRPVGVCGEAAADPLLAPVLVGLGVRSLSMSSRSLPAVRARLAGLDLAQCDEAAAAALAAEEPEQARAAVGALLG